MSSTTFFLSKTMYVTLVRISMVCSKKNSNSIGVNVRWSVESKFETNIFEVYAEARTQIRGTYSRTSNLLSFCSSIERHLNASPNNRSIHISNHSRFSGSKQMLDAQLAAIKRSGNNNKCTTQNCH